MWGAEERSSNIRQDNAWEVWFTGPCSAATATSRTQPRCIHIHTDIPAAGSLDAAPDVLHNAGHTLVQIHAGSALWHVHTRCVLCRTWRPRKAQLAGVNVQHARGLDLVEGGGRGARAGVHRRLKCEELRRARLQAQRVPAQACSWPVMYTSTQHSQAPSQHPPARPSHSSTAHRAAAAAPP